MKPWWEQERAGPEEQDQDLVSNKQVGVTSKMIGDSLGLVLVIPVNKDDRRAGEMDHLKLILFTVVKVFDML